MGFAHGNGFNVDGKKRLRLHFSAGTVMPLSTWHQTSCHRKRLEKNGSIFIFLSGHLMFGFGCFGFGCFGRCGSSESLRIVTVINIFLITSVRRIVVTVTTTCTTSRGCAIVVVGGILVAMTKGAVRVTITVITTFGVVIRVVVSAALLFIVIIRV